MSKSAQDLWLVGLSVTEVSLLTYGTLSAGHVSLAVTLALALILIFLNCTNYQCVAHNFLHNPFFRRERYNQWFSCLNSLSLGAPQSVYRAQHLHHHKYNNDRKIDGKSSLDLTSTYRYSRSATEEEHILSYALLGTFRFDFMRFWRAAKDKRLLHAEAALLISYFVLLAALHPLGFLLFFLPVRYLGQVAALAENYLEHHLAIPGNRRADSVSSYGSLYNLIWFNNGYHQEHHYRPQVHWTRVPELRSAMLPESERRVVPGAHWFNFAWLHPVRVSQAASHCAPSQDEAVSLGTPDADDMA